MTTCAIRTSRLADRAAARPGYADRRALAEPAPYESNRRAKVPVGSVIKKCRKRMAKKKHRKLLKRTGQRRNKK